MKIATTKKAINVILGTSAKTTERIIALMRSDGVLTKATDSSLKVKFGSADYLRLKKILAGADTDADSDEDTDTDTKDSDAKKETNEAYAKTLLDFLREDTIDIDMGDARKAKRDLNAALRKGKTRLTRDNVNNATDEVKQAKLSDSPTKTLDIQIANAKRKLAVLQQKKSRISK